MKYLINVVLIGLLIVAMIFSISCSANNSFNEATPNTSQKQDATNEVFKFTPKEIQPIENSPLIFAVDLSAGGGVNAPLRIEKPKLDKTSTPDDVINSILDSANQVANIEDEELYKVSSINTDKWHSVTGEISRNEGYISFFAENQNPGDEMSANFSFNGINEHAFEIGGMDDSLNSGILIKVRFKDILNNNIEFIYENGLSTFAGFENINNNNMYLNTSKDDIQYHTRITGEFINLINDEWYYFFAAIDENYIYKHMIWQENNPNNNAFYVSNLYEKYKDTSKHGDYLTSIIAVWSSTDVINFDVQSIKIYEFGYSEDNDAEHVSQTEITNYEYVNDYEKYKLAITLFNEEDYYNAYLLLKELNGYDTSESYLKECERLLQTIEISELDIANRIASTLTKQEMNAYDYLYVYQAEKIESLNLSQCKIEDLSFLKYFKNLKELYLDGCGISNLMPLKEMYSLKKLSLAKNNISDALPLYNLVNLKQLDLSNNLIEDVYGLSNLKSLTTLNLSRNNIVFLNGLYGLENLETVDMSNNFIYSINALNNSNVKHLNILNTNILSFGAAGDIESLEELKAGIRYQWKFDAQRYLLTRKYEVGAYFHMGMSGTIHLTHLKNLETLFLSTKYNGTPKVDNHHVNQVHEEMLDIPEYEEYLIENEQDALALSDIVCKQNLIVNIGYNGNGEAVELTISKYVRNLYIHSDSEEEIEIELNCIDRLGLERIVVGNIYISKDDEDGFGSGDFVLRNLDGLAGCANLKELYINSAKTEDINGLADCEKLETLHIRNNKIVDISPLENKAYLKVVDLSGNKISNMEVLESCIRLE
ncbi:MAG: leucine-rich repeat domain-containing protein [Clostridiales bacterium]|nr:leucine-rich repeat domain-containing protein [Clostridiales bacterium]